ncbi:hypothetical protein T492DRAFT_22267 [Pavlovales sp. CCMP2436]|nr:hypothetical protein T492DRAFT_22267 [Pavlovales sp. CCMP2436]
MTPTFVAVVFVVAVDDRAQSTPQHPPPPHTHTHTLAHTLTLTHKHHTQYQQEHTFPTTPRPLHPTFHHSTPPTGAHLPHEPPPPSANYNFFFFSFSLGARLPRPVRDDQAQPARRDPAFRAPLRRHRQLEAAAPRAGRDVPPDPSRLQVVGCARGVGAVLRHISRVHARPINTADRRLHWAFVQDRPRSRTTGACAGLIGDQTQLPGPGTGLLAGAMRRPLRPEPMPLRLSGLEFGGAGTILPSR